MFRKFRTIPVSLLRLRWIVPVLCRVENLFEADTLRFGKVRTTQIPGIGCTAHTVAERLLLPPQYIVWQIHIQFKRFS